MKNWAKCFHNALEKMYEKGENDGEMTPLILEKNQKSVGRIKDNDTVIFACKRGEREIQLTEAFVLDKFDKFKVKKFKNLDFITLIKYDDKFNIDVVYDFEPISQTLAEVISNRRYKQLHLAESEKYAHVTFFFNGRNRKSFKYEKDIFIPSPEIEDLSKKPELSAYEVLDTLKKEIKNNYEFIIVNYANGDVIGHLPDMKAKVECVKHLDKILEKTVDVALKNDYAIVITADHGLIELGMKKLNPPIPNLGHTTNPVPFFVILPNGKRVKLKKVGRLANVAPTILQLMKIEKPELMTEESLIIQELDEKYKVVLVIMDGWGIGPNDERNPIFVAKLKFWNNLFEEFEYAKLEASGIHVGLIEGRPGNSEAGHTNIGAGRIVLQDETIIESDLKSGNFVKRKNLIKALEKCKRKEGDLHIISMLSYGSSHGTMDYAKEIAKKAEEFGIKKVFVHFILNRHGVEGKLAKDLIFDFQKKIEDLKNTEVVTLVGRKWALDRDKNYDRTQKAYDALVYGKGVKVKC